MTGFLVLHLFTLIYFIHLYIMFLFRQALNRSTAIAATNGATVPAVTVFSHALRHFMQQALREISDQSMTPISNDDVRWVITVPAIWSAAAKQLMRQAAYDVRNIRIAFIIIYSRQKNISPEVN